MVDPGARPGAVAGTVPKSNSEVTRPRRVGLSGGNAELGRLARTLYPELEALAEDLVARIRSAQPADQHYDAVPGDDLTDSIRRNLLAVLRVIAGDDDIDTLLPVARSTGQARAAQGVPLETLLRSWRLGGLVIWDGLIRVAGPQDRGALLAAAGQVWVVLDEFSVAVGSGFREAEAHDRARGNRQREAALSGLLEGAGGDPERAQTLGNVLGLDGSSALAVIVFTEGRGPTPVEALLQLGLQSTWTVRNAVHVGLVALGSKSVGQLRDHLRTATWGRVALSPPFTQLADTAYASRSAELALSTLPEDAEQACVLLDDRIVEAIVVSSPELGERLVEVTARALLDKGSEAKDMLDTVEALLRHDGSVSAAARELFVHRNTVNYRTASLRKLGVPGLTTNRDRTAWALTLIALGRLRVLDPPEDFSA